MDDSDIFSDRLQIQYMPLDELLRAHRNPKDHDLGTLNESIDRFGFVSPMLINEKTGRLVAGHGRLDVLQRMKAMGKNPPENIYREGSRWMVPVIRGVEFDTDEEAEAYLIADNRLSELGGWNDPNLTQMLADLATKGEEMLRGIGYDMDDVDDMLRKLERDMKKAEEGEEEEEEEIPEADKMLAKWGVEQDDIWKIGEHYVICGDSTNDETWARLFSTVGITQVDGVFTSPPYADQRSKSNVPNYVGIPEDEYVHWWEAIQRNVSSFLSEKGSFFLNIKPNVVDGSRVLYVFDLVLSMCREWDWKLIDEFCWERLGNPGKWPNRFKNGFEPVYHFARQTDITFRPKYVATASSGKKEVSHNKSTGNYYNMDNKSMEWDEALPSNRIESFGNAMGFGHPAAFPVGLPEFFIKAFSEPGSVWLDPFGGSGTVAVAAHNNDCSALMIEREPKYVAVILERLSKLTGEEPLKVGKENANIKGSAKVSRKK